MTKLLSQRVMSEDYLEICFAKHKVFRETEDVIFYDISIEGNNATDLVEHTGPAISPPDDLIGAKQFYIHYHQVDNNRVVHGSRTFELINFDWDRPYQIVKLDRNSGALKIPKKTYHRSVSCDDGSIVINQSERDDLFQAKKEFKPVSIAKNKKLAYILKTVKPIIIKI